MIRSMFSGVSGLRSHQSRMDVIGNNISNINTPGYKPGRVTFKESIYQSTYNSAGGNEVYGGRNPSQVGYGSQIGGISLDFAPGNYEPTGYGTDCMINGSGFFLVGPKNINPDGVINGGDASQITSLSMTRVGQFTIDGDGYLVDSNRNVVYGFTTADGNAVSGTTPLEPNTDLLVPIRVQGNNGIAITDPDGKPMNLGQISIDDNGILSGQSEDGTTWKIGQIAVANVPNPNALEKIGDSYYTARENTGEIMAFGPGKGTTGALLTNGLEMSKTDLSTEISNMIITQRGFQANSKIITVSDEMLQELISMKR